MELSANRSVLYDLIYVHLIFNYILNIIPLKKLYPDRAMFPFFTTGTRASLAEFQSHLTGHASQNPAVIIPRPPDGPHRTLFIF